MNYQDIVYRLNTIFDSSTLERIKITNNINGEIIIVIDLHRLSCKNAKRLLSNVIANVRIDSRIDVIHGYNHGTSIKDMLLQEFSNVHIIEKHLDPHNQGVTHMSIAA